MAEQTGPAGRGQKALNVVMRAVLSTPGLHRTVSNRVLVLDVVGRKSGRRYRIPVGYTPTPHGLLIGTAGRWRRNLVADRPVRVVVGRRVQSMVADVITDEGHQCGVHIDHARCADVDTVVRGSVRSGRPRRRTPCGAGSGDRGQDPLDVPREGVDGA
jgi:hypothetical protein